jgi:hypothetical protein
MGFERFRQRAPRSHALVDVVEHRLEDRVGHAGAQDVERLDERHAGLEQRRQLLVEDEELAGRHLPPLRQRRQADAGQRAPPGLLNGQDVEALLLELAAKTRLAIGDVDAFDDLAAGRAEPASKFHQ